MGIRFYKALWGMEGELGDQLKQIRTAGYDGFEAPVGVGTDNKGLLADFGLRFVAMLFIEDVDALKAGVAEAVAAGAEKVTVHAGKDWWSFEQACGFWEEALRAISTSPIQVNFETHRARLLFNPASTAAFLARFPDLHLVADFSHWTCVSGSRLSDQEEAVATAIGRTRHIHARVGHEEGPQVPDPRVPQWEPYVAHFELWWDAIKTAHETRGEDLTVTPEFGPPNYMWTNPVDGKPLADLWDVCLWTRDRLKTRWS